MEDFDWSTLADVNDSASFDTGSFNDLNGTGYTPGAMTVGATSWSDVLARGVSRAFDVAGQITLANNLPYYQTPVGQVTATSAANQKTLFMLFAGVALLLVLRGR